MKILIVGAGPEKTFLTSEIMKAVKATTGETVLSVGVIDEDIEILTAPDLTTDLGPFILEPPRHTELAYVDKPKVKSHIRPYKYHR